MSSVSRGPTSPNLTGDFYEFCFWGYLICTLLLKLPRHTQRKPVHPTRWQSSIVAPASWSVLSRQNDLYFSSNFNTFTTRERVVNSLIYRGTVSSQTCADLWFGYRHRLRAPETSPYSPVSHTYNGWRCSTTQTIKWVSCPKSEHEGRGAHCVSVLRYWRLRNETMSLWGRALVVQARSAWCPVPTPPVPLRSTPPYLIMPVYQPGLQMGVRWGQDVWPTLPAPHFFLRWRDIAPEVALSTASFVSFSKVEVHVFSWVRTKQGWYWKVHISSKFLCDMCLSVDLPEVPPMLSTKRQRKYTFRSFQISQEPLWTSTVESTTSAQRAPLQVLRAMEQQKIYQPHLPTDRLSWVISIFNLSTSANRAEDSRLWSYGRFCERASKRVGRGHNPDLECQNLSTHLPDLWARILIFGLRTNLNPNKQHSNLDSEVQLHNRTVPLVPNWCNPPTLLASLRVQHD